MNSIKLTKDHALSKIKQYCVYQERCYAEVKEKLHSYNLDKQEVEEILSQPVEENYLNEERFAIQTLNKLAEQKLKSLRGEKNIFIKKRKLQDFLLRKGYEGELLRELVFKILHW